MYYKYVLGGRWFSGAPSQNKVFDICINALLLIFALFCAFVIFITATAPRGADGASQIFGHELRLVESDSMAPHPGTDVSSYKIGSFKKNTIVALELVPEDASAAADWYSTIKVGDVLTLRYTYDRQVTITHRVVSVEPKGNGNGYVVRLQGDNLNSDSYQLVQEIDTDDEYSTNYIVGRVVWKSHFIGIFVGGFQRVAKSFVGE